MQGLLRTVCVRLTFAQSYTTLIYTVGAFLFFFSLHVCLCTVKLRAVSHIRRRTSHFVLFTKSFSVSFLDFEFRCALVTMAAQATTELATLTD